MRSGNGCDGRRNRIALIAGLCAGAAAGQEEGIK